MNEKNNKLNDSNSLKIIMTDILKTIFKVFWTFFHFRYLSHKLLINHQNFNQLFSSIKQAAIINIKRPVTI